MARRRGTRSSWCYSFTAELESELSIYIHMYTCIRCMQVRFFRKGSGVEEPADAPANLGESHLPRTFESRR